MNMDMDMTMQMTFFASNKVTLFFDGWKTTTNAQMFGTCVAMIVLGFFYEGFKNLRLKLKTGSHIGSGKTGAYGAVDGGGETQPLNFRVQNTRASHIVQTLLHMVQLFLGYLLMLAFMTYNAWVCISVILGAGLGYLVFGGNESMSSEVMGDHCNM